jgi:hypothetical protein
LDSLHSALSKLAALLEQAKAELVRRKPKDVRRLAEEILRLADDLSVFCLIYLELAHPVLVFRTPLVDVQLVQLESKARESLSRRKNLRSEFENN